MCPQFRENDSISGQSRRSDDESGGCSFARQAARERELAVLAQLTLQAVLALLALLALPALPALPTPQSWHRSLFWCC